MVDYGTTHGYGARTDWGMDDLNNYGGRISPAFGGYMTAGTDLLAGVSATDHKKRGQGIGGGIGAAIGTIIAPGIGTAIGQQAGNFIGGLIGGEVQKDEESEQRNIAGAKQDIYRNMYEDLSRLS